MIRPSFCATVVSPGIRQGKYMKRTATSTARAAVDELEQVFKALADNLRKSGLVAARRDGVWMHYQVSRSLNPAIRGIVSAAVDALQPLPAMTQDRRQFQRAFGQLYVPDSPAGGACCAPRAQESQP
jgi:hypothetical protein